jgi:hypothetical protein
MEWYSFLLFVHYSVIFIVYWYWCEICCCCDLHIYLEVLFTFIHEAFLLFCWWLLDHWYWLTWYLVNIIRWRVTLFTCTPLQIWLIILDYSLLLFLPDTFSNDDIFWYIVAVRDIRYFFDWLVGLYYFFGSTVDSCWCYFGHYCWWWPAGICDY